MKSAIAVTGVVLLSAAGCTQQPPAAPAETRTAAPAAAAPTAEQVEEQIAGLEREWVGAIVKGDGATIDRLLADDFVGTSPSAHTYDKSMALADLKSGTYTVGSMELDEVAANVYGNTAVAFTSQEEKSSYAGADTSGHYHFTNVWLNENGTWRVVASHGSRYDRPHETR